MDETIYVILKVLFDFAVEVWFSIEIHTKYKHVFFVCYKSGPLSADSDHSLYAWQWHS